MSTRTRRRQSRKWTARTCWGAGSWWRRRGRRGRPGRGGRLARTTSASTAGARGTGELSRRNECPGRRPAKDRRRDSHSRDGGDDRSVDSRERRHAKRDRRSWSGREPGSGPVRTSRPEATLRPTRTGIGRESRPGIESSGQALTPPKAASQCRRSRGGRGRSQRTREGRRIPIGDAGGRVDTGTERGELTDTGTETEEETGTETGTGRGAGTEEGVGEMIAGIGITTEKT